MIQIYTTIFLFYLTILFSIIFLSMKMNLYDLPSNRKIHYTKTMNTSGLALYIFLLSIIFFYQTSNQLEKIVLSGSIIVIIGFLDDKKNLKPSIKLVLLLIPISYLIIFNDFNLDDLGDYKFIGKIYLGNFGVIFSLLACGLLINAYNYIDGIDGLLISISLSGIIYLIILHSDPNIIKFLILFCLPLIINLFFNFLPISNKFKIFMGNSGSLFIGFFLSFFIIVSYKFEGLHPSFLIWTCWYPVSDFLIVTFDRLINKKSFYAPDNTHFHHLIIKKFKLNHIKTTSLLTLGNMIVMYLGYLTAKNFDGIYSLILFVLFFFIFYFMRLFLIKYFKQ